MAFEEVALRLLALIRDGRFEDVREMFVPSLRPLVSAESLRQAMAQPGPITEVGTPVSDPAGPAGTLVRVPVTFAHGPAAILVTVVGDGQLAGVQLGSAEAAAPAEPWQPPAYADPATFEERPLTVRDVPGTLTLPHGEVSAAVILLPGSGPMDRDETIGRNKPFKDLAWGLASRGVAVVRFDKVTFARPASARPGPDFTVDDEYLPQALAAVETAREIGLKPYVLGHSLGGTVAPRVAVADPGVAGLIILAGGAQPLHRAIVRQVRYLNPDGGDAVEALAAQADAVDAPDLSADTPAAGLPFGTPAAYWLDLRGYRPGEVTAATGKPVLLLQGGRDYQVTVADDLDLWRAALPDATVRVFEADNHLFFPGEGPSTPAEYEPAQHLDPAVIDAIIDWLA